MCVQHLWDFLSSQQHNFASQIVHIRLGHRSLAPHWQTPIFSSTNSCLDRYSDTNKSQQSECNTCLIERMCQFLLQLSAITLPFVSMHHQAGRAVVWSGTVLHESSQIRHTNARGLD